ncbi:MAG: 50S ribosomal protein L19 [Candidatus Paceibacterota bacterium]
MSQTLTAGFSPVNIEERRKIGVRAGDTVRVHVRIQEKGKTRIQIFEGLVLAVKHGTEPGATFTVRRVASGVGVERIFPLYSPAIDKIEVAKRAKVRRSKLYYIREKVAREIRRQMRGARLVDLATMSEAEEKARLEREATEKAEAEAKEAEEKAAKEAEEAAKAEAEKAEAEKEPAPEETNADEPKEETESTEETKKEN